MMESTSKWTNMFDFSLNELKIFENSYLRTKMFINELNTIFKWKVTCKAEYRNLLLDWLHNYSVIKE